VSDATKGSSRIESMKRTAISRRGFIGAGAGVLVAGGILAATTDDGDDDGSSGGSTGSAAGDLAIAKVAAGLEVLAVGTYKAALDAAGAGALGAVPPAVGEFATTAMKNHQAHLDAWNKVLTDAGETAVTEPNAELKPVVDEQFAQVKDVGGAANLALMLEQIAAQTYLKVLPTLSSPEAIQLAGSIQVVDQQHQAVLLFALGQYPVPEVFQKTDQSAA